VNLTHASFFSGAGGTDLGLERAGWQTVSFSEIDPYASAVLAHRWPGVPNLGSITDLAGSRHEERRDEPPVGDAADRGSRLRGPRSSGDGGDAAGARQAGVEHGSHDPGLRPDGGSARAGGPLGDDIPGAQGGEWSRDRLEPGGDDWRTATLWSGGFPCQDLSVAGKRRGMGTHADRSDTRSGLAYAFLDLVERYRPPAILLENVPGLLSSHRGRDFYALQRRMAELGYVGAYRILDGRHFGVPQRRRRVFIVALDARRGATADDAAEVLSVGSRCQRHPPTGGEAGPGAAAEPGGGAVGTFTAGAHPGSYNGQDAYTGHLIPDSVGALNDLRHHGWTANAQSVAQGHIIRQAPDAHRDRETDGLAGRSHDRAGVAYPISGDALRGEGTASTPSADAEGRVRLRDPGLGVGDAGHPAFTLSATEPGAVFVKGKRAQSVEDDESWREGDVAPILNSFDVGDARTTVAVVSRDIAPSLRARGNASHRDDTEAYAIAPTLLAPGPEGGRRDKVPHVLSGEPGADDPLLPLGLDSHRYRCCGNGVIAPVADWIGERLAAVLA
jgi:site-specific DNA-cytosine methylase